MSCRGWCRMIELDIQIEGIVLSRNNLDLEMSSFTLSLRAQMRSEFPFERRWPHQWAAQRQVQQRPSRPVDSWRTTLTDQNIRSLQICLLLRVYACCEVQDSHSIIWVWSQMIFVDELIGVAWIPKIKMPIMRSLKRCPTNIFLIRISVVFYSLWLMVHIYRFRGTSRKLVDGCGV